MIEVDELADVPGLTHRERQVLHFVAVGMSAKQIAQRIEIAPRTVERHIENCRHKLGARNKSHLITKAMASGDLELAPSSERMAAAGGKS